MPHPVSNNSSSQNVNIQLSKSESSKKVDSKKDKFISILKNMGTSAKESWANMVNYIKRNPKKSAVIMFGIALAVASIIAIAATPFGWGTIGAMGAGLVGVAVASIATVIMKDTEKPDNINMQEHNKKKPEEEDQENKKLKLSRRHNQEIETTVSESQVNKDNSLVAFFKTAGKKLRLKMQPKSQQDSDMNKKLILKDKEIGETHA